MRLVTLGVRNFRLDQQCQKRERFLPAGVASFSRNDVRNAFLGDIDLRSTRSGLAAGLGEGEWYWAFIDLLEVGGP